MVSAKGCQVFSSCLEGNLKSDYCYPYQGGSMLSLQILGGSGFRSLLITFWGTDTYTDNTTVTDTNTNNSTDADADTDTNNDTDIYIDTNHYQYQ